MNKLLISLLTGLTIFLAACDTTESDKLIQSITLTKIDVGVKEVYINVKNDNPATDKTVSIFRDGKEIFSFNGEITDTSIADTNLIKSTSYSYSASLSGQSETIGKSNKLNITTLEPTSHEFEWEEHTFGDYQSFLYDVAIIEDAGGEYKIWAVGEIYLKDSEGNYDSQPYGLVKWDGNNWKIERTYYTDYNQTVGTPMMTSTILSFGSDNMYLCSYADLVHWNGNSFVEVAEFIEALPFTGQVSCMWGPDENNIYLGSGRDGSLYHYYGGGWDKLNIGNINGGITDIFGYKSIPDNKWNIFATVTFVGKPSDHKILRINENNSISEFPWKEEERVSNIWTSNGIPVYSAGDGVHIWKGKEWKKIEGLPSKFAGHVAGSALNNIYVVGDFNMILHYNGESWFVIENNKSGWYEYVIVKDNIVVIVGNRDGKGIIKIGRS